MTTEKGDERRRKPRTQVGVVVVFSFGLDRAQATLKNLSMSGALLEPASICPEVGDIVTIFLEGERDEEPEAVNTEVVRLTKEGFAVVFCLPCSIVNDIVEKYGSDSGDSRN